MSPLHYVHIQRNQEVNFEIFLKHQRGNTKIDSGDAVLYKKVTENFYKNKIKLTWTP